MWSPKGIGSVGYKNDRLAIECGKACREVKPGPERDRAAILDDAAFRGPAHGPNQLEVGQQREAGFACR
jgi:hypothetical protein